MDRLCLEEEGLGKGAYRSRLNLSAIAACQTLRRGARSDSQRPRVRLPREGSLRPDGGVVTQRTANPCTPVRFRLGPPLTFISSGRATVHLPTTAVRSWTRSP